MPKESKAAAKDAAKAAHASSTYEFRDTVLAKVRGYPPWPAMVVDPEDVPKNVTKERPSGKKTKFYCVRFFPVGDYAWIVPKDISRLQKHEIEAYINEPHRKSNELLRGYKIALDPTEWETNLQVGQADADAEADEEAANEEVDQLAGESEGADSDVAASASAKKGGKKRKRDSEAGALAKKSAKPKKEKAEGASAPKKRSGQVRQKAGKSKTVVESEDEGAGDDKSAPPTKKAKHDKDADDEETGEGDANSNQVKQWRHKLQKSFLSKDKKSKPEDMPELDETFKLIEAYDMTLEYLSFSKIGKVMRHITKTDDIPRNDEFKFRERANALVDRWGKLANPSKANGASPASKAPASAKANGASKKTPSTAAPVADAALAADESMDIDAKGEPDKDADAPAEPDAEGERVNGEADAPAEPDTAPIAEEAAVEAPTAYAGDVAMDTPAPVEAPAATAESDVPMEPVAAA